MENNEKKEALTAEEILAKHLIKVSPFGSGSLLNPVINSAMIHSMQEYADQQTSALQDKIKHLKEVIEDREQNAILNADKRDMLQKTCDELQEEIEDLKAILIFKEANRKSVQEENKKLREEIRTAIADYMQSEGCGCCSDRDEHTINTKRIAELLDVPPYSDNSGYDFAPFITLNPKDNNMEKKLRDAAFSAYPDSEPYQHEKHDKREGFIKGATSQAVEFAEWILKNEYRKQTDGKNQWWTKLGVDNYWYSQDLYKLFLASPPTK